VIEKRQTLSNVTQSVLNDYEKIYIYPEILENLKET
jgi:hypothetical protein